MSLDKIEARDRAAEVAAGAGIEWTPLWRLHIRLGPPGRGLSPDEQLMTDAATALASALEALKPFAAFNLEDFEGAVLEVVPASPANPGPRIEPILASHFRAARAVHARLMGEQ